MLKIYLIILFSVLTVFAQNQDTTVVKPETPPPTAKSDQPSKWYYGGTIGFNFWSDYFLLSLEPMVGYNVSPKFSLGGKVQYTYINDSQYEVEDLTYHNYGASIFGRFRPIPKMYLHAEFAYMNFESYTVTYDPINRTYEFPSERVWVPFVLLGAGFVQPVSASTSVYAEILFDVLMDDNSPYEDWDPIIHVGVGVGF